MSRCGLLRTCVASLIAIAHIACTRMQDVKGPIGTVSKKLLSLPNFPPSKHGLLPALRRRQWLSAALAFADECILKSERAAEAAFPQSARLFDTIHRLAGGLPAVFEDTLNRFPAASFLDMFGVSSKIGWLNLVISAALSHYWGCSNNNSSRTMNEKEITVDMGWCKNKKSGEEDASFPALQCTKRTKRPQSTESLLGAGLCDEEANNNNTNNVSCKNDVLLVGGEPAAKCTYKDVLTKGVKEEDTEEDHLLEMKKKHHFYEEEEEEEDNNGGDVSGGKSHSNGNGRGKGEKDQILKLFDSSWSVC